MAKSHIFPRALMHEIRGDDTAMFAANMTKGRWIEYQSGPWDRSILCQRCEASLSDCDDYTVRWMRRFSETAKALPDGFAYEAPNPKPKLLVKFAAATLWKAAVAPHFADSNLTLGPWELPLRNFVFGGAAKAPRVFIARKIWSVDAEKHPNIAVPPYDAPSWGKRAYTFDLCGFQWGVRLDGRWNPPTPFHPEFLCNDRDPVRILDIGTKEIPEDDQLLDIIIAAELGRRRAQ